MMRVSVVLLRMRCLADVEWLTVRVLHGSSSARAAVKVVGRQRVHHSLLLMRRWRRSSSGRVLHCHVRRHGAHGVHHCS